MQIRSHDQVGHLYFLTVAVTGLQTFIYWLAPASFSHSAESIVYTQPRFHLKMANIRMKIQQNKMDLIFSIVDVLGSLTMQIDALFSSKSAGVFGFSFGHTCTVKKLSAKKPIGGM